MLAPRLHGRLAEEIYLFENQLVAYCTRWLAEGFMETPRKIIRVRKPNLVGNFRDVHLSRFQQFYRPFEAQAADEKRWVFARQGFQFSKNLGVREVHGATEVEDAKFSVAHFFKNYLPDFL